MQLNHHLQADSVHFCILWCYIPGIFATIWYEFPTRQGRERRLSIHWKRKRRETHKKTWVSFALWWHVRLWCVFFVRPKLVMLGQAKGWEPCLDKEIRVGTSHAHALTPHIRVHVIRKHSYTQSKPTHSTHWLWPVVKVNKRLCFVSSVCRAVTCDVTLRAIWQTHIRFHLIQRPRPDTVTLQDTTNTPTVTSPTANNAS